MPASRASCAPCAALAALILAAPAAAGNLGGPEEETHTVSAGDSVYSARDAHNGRNSDIQLSKEGRGGGVYWTQTFDTGHDERVRGIAKDGQENLYLVGSVSTYAPQETDFLIVAYNLHGGVRWSRTYTAGSQDTLLLVALDPQSNMVVAGTTYDGRRVALWVARYDAAGNRLWDRVHEGAGNLYPRNLYVAPSGEAVITYEEAWGQGSQVFTTKTTMYNPHGGRTQ